MENKPPFFEEFNDWLVRKHPNEAHLPNLLKILKHQLAELQDVDTLKEVAMKFSNNPNSKFYTKAAATALRKLFLNIISRGKLN